jgi:hypothetical protein
LPVYAEEREEVVEGGGYGEGCEDDEKGGGEDLEGYELLVGTEAGV